MFMVRFSENQGTSCTLYAAFGARCGDPLSPQQRLLPTSMVKSEQYIAPVTCEFVHEIWRHFQLLAPHRPHQSYYNKVDAISKNAIERFGKPMTAPARVKEAQDIKS